MTISKLEDGRIIKLADATFYEWNNGEWTLQTAPINLGDHWNADYVSDEELEALGKML
jgi:hypothetical protein